MNRVIEFFKEIGPLMVIFGCFIMPVVLEGIFFGNPRTNQVIILFLVLVGGGLLIVRVTNPSIFKELIMIVPGIHLFYLIGNVVSPDYFPIDEDDKCDCDSDGDCGDCDCGGD